MGQAALFVGEPDEVVQERRRALRERRRVQAQSQAPRLVELDRTQIELRPQDLDSLLPPQSPRPVGVGGAYRYSFARECTPGWNPGSESWADMEKAYTFHSARDFQQAVTPECLSKGWSSLAGL